MRRKVNGVEITAVNMSVEYTCEGGEKGRTMSKKGRYQRKADFLDEIFGRIYSLCYLELKMFYKQYRTYNSKDI